MEKHKSAEPETTAWERIMRRLLDIRFSLNVTNARCLLQEGPVAEESFIPEFDGRSALQFTRAKRIRRKLAAKALEARFCR